jgi:phage terminase large subunit
VLDEALYATGHSNRMIADTIRVREGLPPVQQEGKYVGRTRVLTVGDSAEPKSNDELKDSYGILITGAVKGEGSVNYGIQLLQQQQIYVTQRSTNIIKECRSYLWKKDGLTDKPLNVPVDARGEIPLVSGSSLPWRSQRRHGLRTKLLTQPLRDHALVVTEPNSIQDIEA